MSVIIEVIQELVGMFITDAMLTISILILVALVATLVLGLHVAPLFGGGVLLLGSLSIVIYAALLEARRRDVS